METPQAGHLRIGELSQRTGVSPELLRAWERRYGLLRPSRSAGGFRLYSGADEARVRRMKAYLAQGVAAAEAARLADRPKDADASAGSLEVMRAELGRALETFDEATAQRVLDAALGSFSVDGVIADLLVPYLDDLGERWARGEVTVAQEHFSSNVIRERLLAFGRSWDGGFGPRALLACPEGELHDLGLVLFGVALGRRGWRITFLGANTPLSTVIDTARRVRPEAVVIAVTDPKHVEGSEAHLAALTGDYRLIFAGRGAADVASTVGVELFDLDPVTAAERLTAST
jgi:MerR family transcriptional regulator, light-induced transcriptional regulator